MLKTEFKLEYKIEESPTDGGVPVIVVAAGSSTRMNGINKQTAPLWRSFNNKNSYAL